MAIATTDSICILGQCAVFNTSSCTVIISQKGKLIDPETLYTQVLLGWINKLQNFILPYRSILLINSHKCASKRVCLPPKHSGMKLQPGRKIRSHCVTSAHEPFNGCLILILICYITSRVAMVFCGRSFDSCSVSTYTHPVNYTI